MKISKFKKWLLQVFILLECIPKQIRSFSKLCNKMNRLLFLSCFFTAIFFSSCFKESYHVPPRPNCGGGYIIVNNMCNCPDSNFVIGSSCLLPNPDFYYGTTKNGYGILDTLGLGVYQTTNHSLYDRSLVFI